MPDESTSIAALQAEIQRLTRQLENAERELSEARRGSSSRSERTESLFQAIYQNAEHFAGILDTRGVVEHANAVALRFIGCSEEEVVGRSFADTPWWAGLPAAQEELRAAIGRAARGAPVRYQTIHRTSDGSLHPLELSLRPVQNAAGEIFALVSEGWDITEVRRVEETLARTRLLLEAVVEQSPVAMIVVTYPDLIVRYSNRAMLEVLGITNSQETDELPLTERIAHQSWRDINEDGSPLPISERPLARALRGEAIRDMDYWIVRSDGSRRRLLVSAVPIRNQENLIIAGVMVLQDVTVQWQSVEQLRIVAQEQQAILDTASVGIVLLRDRRYQWTNHAHLTMFGFSADELKETASTKLHYAYEEDFERVGREGYTALAEGRVYTTEALMKRKSGERFWCSLSGKALTPEQLENGSIWVLQDINERKLAEFALKASERRLERLVENSNDLITIVDASGVVISCLGPLKRVAGFEPEELIGHSGVEFVHPEDRSRVSEVLQTTVDQPGMVQRVEYRYRHKSGDWIPMEVVGTNWLHEPNIRGIVLNIRDISQRKRAERDQAKLQEQLQHALKMEAIGRLAGGVAHDFNNLLTVIQGNVELARDSVRPPDPLFQHLSEISRATNSAAALTRQLLAFSRRQVVEPKVVSLNEHLAELKKMLRRLLGEDIELELMLAQELGAVRVDPGQFEQVVVNLAVNARDSMPGGGWLRIETANVELDGTFCSAHPNLQSGPYVMMAVSDNGQGMTPEIRQHIFEPFFTTKPKGHGTGLGLATIFGIIQQAGGAIDVYSELEQGTTFKVYLPRIDAPVERPSPPTVRSGLPRGNETILLVEDEPGVRELITAILKRLGYNLLVAASGGEALVLLEQHTSSVHLLLTDIVMPGMNGRELASRVQDQRPDLAVLYISGYTEDAMVHRGLLTDRLQFLGKPFTIKGIATKVRQVLDARSRALQVSVGDP